MIYFLLLALTPSVPLTFVRWGYCPPAHTVAPPIMLFNDIAVFD